MRPAARPAHGLVVGSAAPLFCPASATPPVLPPSLPRLPSLPSSPRAHALRSLHNVSSTPSPARFVRLAWQNRCAGPNSLPPECVQLEKITACGPVSLKFMTQKLRWTLMMPGIGCTNPGSLAFPWLQPSSAPHSRKRRFLPLATCGKWPGSPSPHD